MAVRIQIATRDLNVFAVGAPFPGGRDDLQLGGPPGQTYDIDLPSAPAGQSWAKRGAWYNIVKGIEFISDFPFLAVDPGPILSQVKFTAYGKTANRQITIRCYALYENAT